MLSIFETALGGGGRLVVFTRPAEYSSVGTTVLFPGGIFFPFPLFFPVGNVPTADFRQVQLCLLAPDKGGCPQTAVNVNHASRRNICVLKEDYVRSVCHIIFWGAPINLVLPHCFDFSVTCPICVSCESFGSLCRKRGQLFFSKSLVNAG